MKPVVYVETSVISYLAARPSRDVLTQARQIWTWEWWNSAQTHWTLKVSEMVIEEAVRGNPDAAGRRLDLLHGLDVVGVDDEARAFAQRLLDVGALPKTEPEDALHVAVSAVIGARYLVSWNFAHLVGPEAKIRLLEAVRVCGRSPALLATPEELLEESR